MLSPYFLGEQIPIVVDLLNNDRLTHPLNIIMHSETHLIRLAAGLRPDPLGGELNSTRETPALSNREPVLKKVGQNVGDEKE